jgi:IK cytokine
MQTRTHVTYCKWFVELKSCFPFREEKKEEPETPRYRDRAKERREDQNPDYEPTELGSFHAVAPPGTDLR